MSKSQQKARGQARENTSGQARENTRGQVRENARGQDSHDNLSDNLRDSAMMAHLLDALEAGTDIGEYGRLVFTIVARHFMSEDELVTLLGNQPGLDEEQARALVLQVSAKDYNPPKRERIVEWQASQDFPICPDADDPNGCNVYRELRFPQEVYDRIGEFWQERAAE